MTTLALFSTANFSPDGSQKPAIQIEQKLLFPTFPAGTTLAQLEIADLSVFALRNRKQTEDNRMINTNMTVRDVAIELPQATRLFEKLKIDYCCGGNQPLNEACASAGIDVDNVMEMLAEVTKSTAPGQATLDYQNASLADLITHIVNTHHVFTRSEMDRLQLLADKVLAAHGGNHPELIHLDELLTRLCADLKPHMFKEEQILFPYIVAMAEAADQNRAVPCAPFGTVNNPIRMMMMEHDTAGQILRELRTLTSDYKAPADACVSYQTLYQALENFERDLHQHIHLENNILFPKAVGLEINRHD